MTGKTTTGRGTKRALAALTLVSLFATVFAAFPSPAAAQLATVEGGPLAATTVKDSVQHDLGDILVTSAVTALVNGANYFASQIAYQAAVALTSDCAGQGPCWDSKSFKQGFKESWQGAIGETVGSLSQGLLGNTALCTPNIAFQLSLQLGLLNDAKPRPPKCNFNAIATSWTKLVASGQILEQLKPVFKPGQAPLAVGLDILDGSIALKADAKLDYTINQLRHSGGGGFSDVTDQVSGRIKAPAAVVQSELDTLIKQRDEAPKQSTDAANSGAIARGAVASVALNATQTFVQTLVTRLWNKMVNGLLSTDQLLAVQPDIIFDPNAVLNPPGKSAQQESLQTRFVTASTRDVGAFDPLLQYISCPGTGAGPDNCVMDGQFANAVRLGDALPLTVAQAMQKGMLHKDWPLVPATVREKDTDPFCYTYGYCESNLKKLRAARIIPVGWEIAASESKANALVSLGEVVSRFNDCDADGQLDDKHPYCHLIDPNWVLKAPPAQCRAQVFGPTLVSPEASSRAETCADVQTCLKQDDLGSCIGGWGYCTRERSVWRFQGDQCPAYYASCRSLTTRSGTVESLLTNTITPGVCNADNVGCSQYALEANLAQDPAVASDDFSTTGAQRFLNHNAETCQVSDAGCSALVPLTRDQSLNLVRNGGFEQMADGDGNGTPDHAAFWLPFGQSPASGSTIGSGFVDQHGTYSSSGSNAIAVGLADAAFANRTGLSTNCTLPLSGTNISVGTCTADGGCVCTYSGAATALQGYTCDAPKGARQCVVTSRVMQTDIPLRPNTTYVASATFTSAKSSPSAPGAFRLQFYDAQGIALRVTAAQVNRLTTTFTGGSATASSGSDCQLVVPSSGPSYLSVAWVGTKSAGSAGIRASCVFQVRNPNVAETSFELVGTGSSTGLTDAAAMPYADDVQLEESAVPTPFHEAYGNATAVDYLKIPPAYLGCTGEATDRPECASYAQVCRQNEVGCTAYVPLNGDPTVPAVVGPQDSCPAECSGYDTYKQGATEFDGTKPTLDFFIPSTATQCSAAESGCSQFTDVATEQVSYFSKLRICEKPNSDPQTVFYSWEGSDTTGFQLRAWNLKRTTAALSSGPSDVPVSGSGTAGTAPCTKLAADGITCVNPSVAPADPKAEGVCTRADIDAGNFDCREFYDQSGNRHYRLYSKTIILTAECTTYRITASNATDCAASNGRWDGVKDQCLYAAAATESAQCDAKVSGCRPYKGNASGNVRTPLSEDFETGATGWSGGGLSSESVVVGGHSYKLTSGNAAATKDVTGMVAVGRSYTLTFWARGLGTVVPALTSGSASVPFGSAKTLTSDWRQYTFGPMSYAGAVSALTLSVAKTGNSDVFVDNVILKEVQDDIYVVRDSWKTPASCDQTADGLASPQEMLGCREYSSANGTAHLRSFSAICRQQAIGCQAYSDTRNTVADPYASSYQAVCTLPTSAPGVAGGVCAAGNCTCDYDTRSAVQTEKSGLTPVLLPAVCTVKVGEKDCRFDLPGRIDDAPSAVHPDRVTVSSDQRVYLAATPADSCQSAAIGCTAMGAAKTVFEQTCTLPTTRASASLGNVRNGTCDDNSCTCTLGSGATAVSCTAGRGSKSCVIPSDTGVIAGWSAVGIKDDPSRYATTLCTQPAIACEQFSSSDGTFYFKEPGDQTCQYKEGVSIGGQARYGWFRKSAGGADIPCYPNLLKDGEYYSIAKNDDPTYQGWVGTCTPEADRCEEFVDPAATSDANPNGQPYYYLMNDKIDQKSCAGGASLNEGCVAFRRTSDTARTIAAYATYFKSDKETNGAKVPAIDCNTDPRAPECEKRCVGISNGICSKSKLDCTGDAQCGSGQTCVGDTYYAAGCNQDSDCNQSKGEACSDAYGRDNAATNDANIVIAVKRDRECAEWLQCDATDTVWDAGSGKWKDVCVSVGACSEQRKVGQSQECGKPVDDPQALLTPTAYSSRDVSYQGSDYSGFSIAGRYPAQFLSPAPLAEGTSFGIDVGPASGRCTSDANCPNAVSGKATCAMNGRCYVDIQGRSLHVAPSEDVGQCRGYPEVDSPFNASSLVTTGQNGKAQQIQPGFKGANFCAPGNDCSCSYVRDGYGQGGTTSQFYGSALNANTPAPAAPDIICSGGTADGQPCADKSDSACTDGGGTCQPLTKQVHVVGWRGYCLDPDYSFNVAGDSNAYACNLWLPIDQLPGAEDVYNQHVEAGFQTTQSSLVYCKVAQGNDAAGKYENTFVDQIGDLRARGGERGESWGWIALTSGGFGIDTGNELVSQHLVPGSAKWPYSGPKIYRSQVAGLHMFVNNGYSHWGVNGGAGASSSTTEFYLTDDGTDKAWTFGIGWSTDGDHGIPVGGLQKSDTSQNCFDLFGKNESSINSSCHGRDSYCVRANWGSDDSLASIDTVSCNEDQTCGADDGCPNFLFTGSALMRESCQELSIVSDSSKFADQPNVTWTDHISKDFSTPLAQVSGKRDTNNDLTPFGRMFSPVLTSSRSKISFRGTDIWDFQPPVFDTEGGSPYTKIAVTLTQQSGLQVNATADNNIAGIPYACIGPCKASSTVPDAWQNQGANASQAGEDALSQLFVVGWRNFVLSSPAAKDYRPPSGSPAYGIGTPAWDHRADFATPSSAPTVHAVRATGCASAGNCPEGTSPGMSVNGFSSGNVTADGGKIRTVITFYGYADKDHLPIREKTISFGDGTSTDSNGYFKNRRGCLSGANGLCTSPSVSYCDGSNAGAVPNACDNSYYSVDKVYTCSQQRLVGPDAIPFCSASSGYPCQRDGACVFKPRVRLVDNWGQCNGSCPGGTGSGNTCINAKLDSFSTDDSQECGAAYDPGTPSTWRAWTEYAGEIILKP